MNISSAIVRETIENKYRYFLFINDEYVNDYKTFTIARRIQTRMINKLVNDNEHDREVASDAYYNAV